MNLFNRKTLSLGVLFFVLGIAVGMALHSITGYVVTSTSQGSIEVGVKEVEAPAAPRGGETLRPQPEFIPVPPPEPKLVEIRPVTEAPRYFFGRQEFEVKIGEIVFNLPVRLPAIIAFVIAFLAYLFFVVGRYRIRIMRKLLK